MVTYDKRMIMEPPSVPRKRRKSQEESNSYTMKVAPGLLVSYERRAGQSLPLWPIGCSSAANSADLADLIERNT